ncbi:MAG: endo-1,4-beta-xylanase [Bacteroidales bacterium]|nr:endo-1,4-beta-xylanase [Bacteroidales bacterium]
MHSLIADGYPIGSNHPYYNHFKYFNSVTPENAGKWKLWINPHNRQTYAQMREWFVAQGIDNRGHGTVWETLNFGGAVPDVVLNETDTAKIRQIIKAHIIDQVTELQQNVYELDLVNEPVHETYIAKTKLGWATSTEMAKERALWHNWAKEAAPDLPLVVNEFAPLQYNDNFDVSFVAYVQDLVANGADVAGIGLQGHFFETIPTVQELQNDWLKSVSWASRCVLPSST